MEKKINPEKEKMYSLIDSYLDAESNIFFADYRGLTVEQFSQLRKKLRKNNSEIHVVKNKITKLVLKSRGFKDEALALLKGPTAIVLSKGDETISVAKDVMEFSGKEEIKLKVKGASIEKEVYGESAFIAFSKLPTKSELYAKLMGTIQAPITNTVSLINNVIAKLARTLQAAVDENKFN